MPHMGCDSSRVVFYGLRHDTADLRFRGLRVQGFRTYCRVQGSHTADPTLAASSTCKHGFEDTRKKGHQTTHTWVGP